MRNPSLLLGFLPLALLSLVATPAQAQHDVNIYLSPTGVEFVENNAGSYLPSVFEPPTVSKSFACMDFVQRDTVVNMSLDNLEIEFPSEGRIKVDIEFSIAAQGEFHADDLYACLGSATCQDSMAIEGATASFDFDLRVVNGTPQVAVREIAMDLNPDDFSFSLDGCGITGGVLNKAVGFAKGWILNFIEGKVVSLAEENMGPMLENMLAGLSLDSAYLLASVQDMRFSNGGVSIKVDAGVTEKFEAAACVADFDVGPPAALDGVMPELEGPGASQLNLALNFGLINQALYTAWHRGLLCLSDGHLAALGVHMDLNAVGALLPGFPAGTEFAMEFSFRDYPRVRGGSDSSLVVDIQGLMLDLHGDRPDGTRNTLHAEIDLEASAKIVVDPGSNAIFAQLQGATIKHLLLSDEREATGDGFDVARLTQLVHEAILPKLLEKMGPLPVTGSVFAVPGHAVLLRDIASTPAYLSAGVDLFRIPENDKNSPNTEIQSQPTGVSNPGNALLRVGGSDAEIPEELLQYLIRVDGVERPLSFIRDIKLGEFGRTATYQVSVAAVDLAGNVDATPATASITVDGMTPFVVINGARNRSADEGPVKVSWTMNDDTSAREELRAKVEIYHLENPADALSARLVDTQELGAGAVATTVDLANAGGGVYRVVVNVQDAAGNSSQSSLLLSVSSSGGCSVGAKGGKGGILLLIAAMGFISLRSRRRVQP